MKFCGAHWKGLRDAIGARGMRHLISRSADEAASRMRRGTEDDPLLLAMVGIINECVEMHETLLRSLRAEQCPLCCLPVEIDRKDLIERHADKALRKMRAKGLMRGH